MGIDLPQRTHGPAGLPPPAVLPATDRLGAFAALDLGTNNCRLLVASPVGDHFRVLDSFSRIVRLGEGLHDTGTLSGPAMDRAIVALQGCAERLARRPVRAVRAIATEACRRASNGRTFLDRVHAETGFAFDVISTREEAELALESCAPLLTPLAEDGARRALLFDIGGGSTELAWVRLSPTSPPALSGYVSLPIGVVAMADRLAADGFDAVVAYVARLVAPFGGVHCLSQELRQGGVVLLGTSGTITTLAGIARDLPRYRRPLVDGLVLTQADIAAAMGKLRAMTGSELAAHPCIGPERADFVLPGCAIFSAIHEAWPAPRVVVADRGLREGMLLRLMRGESVPPRAVRRPLPAIP